MLVNNIVDYTLMMFLSIPLLRHPRDHHHSVNQRGTDRLPQHRRCKILADMHQLNITSSPVIYWLTLVIIIAIATTTSNTVFSVAGFQRHIQYPQLQSIGTTLSLRKSPTLPLLTVDTERRPTISIQLMHQQQTHLSSSRRSKTQLYFMGSDSGILGVGGPEVVRISFLCKCYLSVVTPYL
jgi:hypothetical protein